MDSRTTKTAEYQSILNSISNCECDEIIRQRLDSSFEIKAEEFQQKQIYRFDSEETAAELMQNPLSGTQTFSLFGLLLGIFVPAAVFTRILVGGNGLKMEDSWILGVLAIVNVITAVVGFFSGRIISKIVFELEKFSWVTMILLLPFIGIFWGVMAGGAGGVIILIFGAFIGAFFGGVVGSAALPMFTIFHRLLKNGDYIERGHFLPIALGITFTICAFILGL